LEPVTIGFGAGQPLGNVKVPLHDLHAPARYRIVIKLEEAKTENDWDVWIYPDDVPRESDNVIVTDSVQTALDALADGRRVLLAAKPKHPDGESALGLISVFSFGPGSVAARLADNVVSGTAGEGSREAITVYASMGAIEALIVNNTLAENQTAIAIGGRPDLGGSFDGLVANNAIVGNERGLNVDPGAGTIPDRNNLYFDNTHDLGDGETPALPGPNSIFGMDPLFVASSDFRPDAASPLVDAGDTAAVPFDLTSDVTGGPRILGGIVDIGAHEVPEPSGPLAAGAAAAALAALARFRAPRSTASGRRAAGGSDAYLRHPQPVQAGPTRRHRRAQTDLAFGPWHPPRGRTPRRGRAGQRVESSHGLGTRSAALHAER
jgi:hypothetical protein